MATFLSTGNLFKAGTEAIFLRAAHACFIFAFIVLNYPGIRWGAKDVRDRRRLGYFIVRKSGIIEGRASTWLNLVFISVLIIVIFSRRGPRGVNTIVIT